MSGKLARTTRVLLDSNGREVPVGTVVQVARMPRLHDEPLAAHFFTRGGYRRWVGVDEACVEASPVAPKAGRV